MQLPTIIYYGKEDLRSQVLCAYFAKLNCGVQVVRRLPDLFTAVSSVPNPIVILCDTEPAPTLVRLARAVIPDLDRPVPPVYILYDGEPFDAKLPAVTVITGPSKLGTLTRHLSALPALTGLSSPHPTPVSATTGTDQLLSAEEWENLRKGLPEQLEESLRLRYWRTLRHKVQGECQQSRLLQAQTQELHNVVLRLLDSIDVLGIHTQSLRARSVDTRKQAQRQRALRQRVQV